MWATFGDHPAATVTAGAAQSVASRASVTLTGTGADANVPARTLTYLWTQTDGPAVTLATPTQALTTFTAPIVAGGEAPMTVSFTLGTASLITGLVQWLSGSSTIGGISPWLVRNTAERQIFGLSYAFYYA